MTPSITSYFPERGEINEIYYQVDLNQDRKFDPKEDTFAGKYEYCCLMSGFSFSCANYYSTLLKEKGLAKHIGNDHSGVVCIVRTIATASGTVFRNSRNIALDVYDTEEETFRCCENGIDADIHLGYEDYFNPVKIAEAIATAKS